MRPVPWGWDGSEVTFNSLVQENLASRWDQEFEKQYVNRPQWHYERHDKNPGAASSLWGWIRGGL